MKNFKTFCEDAYKKSLPPGVRQDMEKGGKTRSPMGDLAQLGATAAAVKLGAGPAISTGLRTLRSVDTGLRSLRAFGRKTMKKPGGTTKRKYEIIGAAKPETDEE